MSKIIDMELGDKIRSFLNCEWEKHINNPTVKLAYENLQKGIDECYKKNEVPDDEYTSVYGHPVTFSLGNLAELSKKLKEAIEGAKSHAREKKQERRNDLEFYLKWATISISLVALVVSIVGTIKAVQNQKKVDSYNLWAKGIDKEQDKHKMAIEKIDVILIKLQKNTRGKK